MSFENRADAGRRLAKALLRFRGQHPVIFALPRGGVIVAAEVAAALGALIDLLIVRKIGVPAQPELAMGAIVDGVPPLVVRNQDVIEFEGIEESAFERACERELTEIERRRAVYLGNRRRIDVAGGLAIVVDDGIATGATMRAALREMRLRGPKTLVLAVPVAAEDTLATLRSEADEIVCLEAPASFGALGYFYQDFAQNSDQEVIDILARFAPRS